MNGSITDASQDERFSTFFRRVSWVKDPKETDEAFAKKLGIAYSKYKGWKYRGYQPDFSTVADMADRLNVCVGWLGAGRGHYVANHPGVRVTMIPREPIVIYEDLETGEDIAFAYELEGAFPQ